MAENKLKELVGINLDGFKIIEAVKVVRLNEEGMNPQTLGYFKDATVAGAFAGPQVNGNQTRTWPSFVLTNGTIGYEIGSNEPPVVFFNDEEEAKKLKEKALEKLSPEEKMLLGLA